MNYPGSVSVGIVHSVRKASKCRGEHRSSAGGRRIAIHVKNGVYLFYISQIINSGYETTISIITCRVVAITIL